MEAQFLEEALADVASGDVIVDVGAGSGRLEFALLGTGARIIATEVTRSELALMEHHDRVDPVHVGAHPSLPLRDQSVNAVIAIEVPAVSDLEWFKSECHRVLRPGGRVIVSVHNAHSYKGLWNSLPRRGQQPGWTTLYYQKRLSRHMADWRAHGFRC